MDHLHQLYQMYNEELNQLLENIMSYLRKSNKVFDMICEHEQALRSKSAIALMAYDKFFTNVTNMLDVARKFNLHLHINDLEEQSTRTLFQALNICGRNGQFQGGHTSRLNEMAVLGLETSMKTTSLCDDNITEVVDGSQLSADTTNNEENNYKRCFIPPAEEKEYVVESSELNGTIILPNLRKDISNYQVGNLLKASVTYLRDLQTLSFFVCDAESPEMQQIANLKDMLHLRQYTGLPPENEVFGLVLDNMILRAVRQGSLSLTSRKDEKHTVLLLDFGEIFAMFATDVTYRLPEEFKRIPAQAILCKLNGICGRRNVSVEELQTYLKELEYEKTTFRVHSKQENDCVLEVELILDVINESSTPRSLKNEVNKSPNKKINTNPFLCDVSLTIDESDEAIPLNALPMKSLFDVDTEQPPNGLTAAEMDMLAEEPLNTSNAMTAVMGYNPKDDQRICRFYNPKTGSCFKGANCRLEHTPLQPDGWTKDRVPAARIIDNNLPTTRYKTGLVINITPTHVGQLEYFYAQINDPNFPVEPLIWNDEDVPQHLHLTKPPMLYDVVRARYDDDHWYRAKVVDFDDTYNNFKVFYVDYGNYKIVSLKHLAYCDRSTERFPFQAVLCRVADIMQNPAATPEQFSGGVCVLNALILNRTFDVKVVHHREDLIVRFMGAQYSQIPKRLIAMGCAKQYHSNGPKSMVERTLINTRCS